MRVFTFLFLALPLPLVACKNTREAPISADFEKAAAAVVADAGASDASVDGDAAPSSMCEHRRPFEGLSAPPKLVVPAPYDVFTPCDLLQAIYPDYEKRTNQSVTAGGTLAIDRVSLWQVSGRNLLAILFYIGKDAELDMMYGQIRVAVHLAVVEKQNGTLVRVGKPKDPWRPEEKPDEILALFDGRAEFETKAYSILPGERLLAIRTPWSMGMSGYWELLTLYRLSGSGVDQVFEHELQTTGLESGSAEHDVVRSEMTFEAREGEPSDIRIVNTEEICTTDFDKPGSPVTCKNAVVVGKEKWRFKGAEYKRVEGKHQPLPRVLRNR